LPLRFEFAFQLFFEFLNPPFGGSGWAGGGVPAVDTYFSWFEGQLEPTRYEILHESQHIEHLRQIGAKRYIELSKTKAGNLELEQFVYDNLRRHHWSSLTPDEIKHAQWYICDVLGGNAW
jgi:hypothetical protein